MVDDALFEGARLVTAYRVMVELLDFDGRLICQFEVAVYSNDKPFGVLRWRGAVFVALPITTTVAQFRRVRERTFPDGLGDVGATMLPDDWGT